MLIWMETQRNFIFYEGPGAPLLTASTCSSSKNKTKIGFNVRSAQNNIV